MAPSRAPHAFHDSCTPTHLPGARAAGHQRHSASRPGRRRVWRWPRRAVACAGLHPTSSPATGGRRPYLGVHPRHCAPTAAPPPGQKQEGRSSLLVPAWGAARLDSACHGAVAEGRWWGPQPIRHGRGGSIMNCALLHVQPCCCLKNHMNKGLDAEWSVACSAAGSKLPAWWQSRALLSPNRLPLATPHTPGNAMPAAAALAARLAPTAAR